MLRSPKKITRRSWQPRTKSWQRWPSGYDQRTSIAYSVHPHCPHGTIIQTETAEAKLAKAMELLKKYKKQVRSSPRPDCIAGVLLTAPL
jgi:hypothetical protein